MKYYHVDVFTDKPLAGNGLAVVFPENMLKPDEMLDITREFRQFETIFVQPEKEDGYPARIFTVEEELGFAGHPLLGAAAVIHQKKAVKQDRLQVKLLLGTRSVDLVSVREEEYYSVEMNQGPAGFSRRYRLDELSEIIAGLNLAPDDIRPDYPVETVSTGLPYLLLPLGKTLEKAEIVSDRFEQLLSGFGAKFIYIFNPEHENGIECRTWDNSGKVEDAATGSAAGPLCAYLVKNGFYRQGEEIKISQGTYAGRPSVITSRVDRKSGDVFISGRVSFFAEGEIII